jgi:V/A-type H+-transporting ATPase subunit E
MNGIQKIIDRIEADAAAERAQIAAEAEARCAETEAAYAKAAQAEYEKLVTDAQQSVAQRLERKSGAAATEAKKQMLAAKQEMVLAAFDRAAQLISGLPDAQYISFLARLASRASRTGTEMLAFSEQDARRVGTAVKDAANALLRQAGKTADLTVSPETRHIRGGVIVLSGDIETNCSIDALLAMERNALSGEVAAKLFS